MKHSEILGIDIGGTGIKVAPVMLTNGTLTRPVEYMSTPAPFAMAAVVKVISDMVHNLEWNGDIGIGYPGVVQDRVALSAANVSEEWLGIDLVKLFSGLTNGNVSVINDADAAGVAEMKFGAGKEQSSSNSGTVLLLTLGTGIGSALFHNGHLIPNTEFGHTSIDGMEAEAMAAGSIRSSENLSWKDWGKRLNRFLSEMEMLLTPELIIIGGGISENFENFSEFLDTRSKIVTAKMGNNAGIVGAALGVHFSGNST